MHISLERIQMVQCLCKKILCLKDQGYMETYSLMSRGMVLCREVRSYVEKEWPMWIEISLCIRMLELLYGGSISYANIEVSYPKVL